MNGPSPRRSGRPGAEATERLNGLIVSTATRLFIDQGYDATSIEQIAAAIGASKQTLYRRYASKQELFVAVMLEQGRNLRENSFAVVDSTMDPLEAARHTCFELLSFVARPDVMAIYRTLIAEALRFPSLVERVRLAAIEPLRDVIRTLFRNAREAGRIRGDIEVEDALRGATGITIGWFLSASLMEPDILPTPEARRIFFDKAWDIFLLGIQTQGIDPTPQPLDAGSRSSRPDSL